MTKKKDAAAVEDAPEGMNINSALADRLSNLMVCVRTSQATGQFTPEQEAEWMAIDAELRGTVADAGPEPEEQQQ